MSQNFINTCRVCLSKCSSDLINIGNTHKTLNEFLTVGNILMECTSILALEDDELPKKICAKCFDILKTSYKFKKLCENSYQVLKIQLLSLKIDEAKTNYKSVETNNILLKSEYSTSDDEDTYLKNKRRNECLEDDNKKSNLRSKRIKSYLNKQLKFQNKKDINKTPNDDINYQDNHNQELNYKQTLNSSNEDELEDKLKDDIQIKMDDVYKANVPESKCLKKSNLYCTQCKRKFKTQYAFKLHAMSFHHQDEESDSRNLYYDEDKYVCYLCQERFGNQKAFVEHKSKHETDGNYCCLKCDMKYFSLKYLKEHSNTHFKRKPQILKCPICGKIIQRFSNLKLHMRIHSDVKKELCTICGKSFRYLQSLIAHTRIHTGEKPYECNVCHVTFRQKSSLNFHYLIHTNERKYACNLCNKTYKRNRDLKIHYLQHKDIAQISETTVKPHQCGHCNKSFMYPLLLQDHIRVEHEGMKFTCQFCNKDYNIRKSYRDHLKRKHPHLLATLNDFSE